MSEREAAPARIAFDDLGSGPAVVLIHGHPFNRSMWSPQREPLVRAGFRIVIPDLRGYGDSSSTLGVVTMAELAGDIIQLLDSLEVEEAAVVGLSMGGLVAMELATTTERLSALGLVATTAEPVTAVEREQRLQIADAADADGIEPVVAAMVPQLFAPGCPPAVVERVLSMMRSSDPHGAAAALRGRAQRPDYRPRLKTLDLPAFVCVGTDDPWSTAEVTEELVGSLRSPRTVTFPRIGHLPNLEAPEDFNRELIDFLHQALETGPARQV
jgi:3-oxoadipate enol-lactonase